MSLSFRQRLTLWYTLVLASLLGVAAAVLIITLQNAAARKLDATLWILGATEAEGVAARMRDRSLLNPDDLTIHDVDYRDLAGFSTFRVQKYVTVVDDQKRVADFSSNLPNQPLPVKENLIAQALQGNVLFDTAEVGGIGEVRMVYVPVTQHETQPFVVIVGVPSEFVGAEVVSLSRGIAVTLVIILVLAGVCGMLLARRALRPVAETAARVQGITDRNLHERLLEPQTNDEIAHLIKVFNQLLARLDHAFDAQRRFTADASHELCTPLTVLKGTTQVALLEPHDLEEYENVLKSNLEEIERLSVLTSSLLQLARADAGEQQLSQELVVLNEVIDDVHARLSPMAAERGVTLSADTAPIILIEGDQVALRQIIFNLAHNAIRYTPSGGTVHLALAELNHGEVGISITDNGIGIAPDSLPHIFERFYRSSQARSHESMGSGLGLAICQTLAEAHNGRIEVESSLNKGSRFTLILPALEKVEAESFSL